MTPNFALSLSFDGIALLQQVPDGWHLVGEVPLETADLPAALSDLRDQALMLDPSGLRTKLVIPSDQIRYMTLQGEDTTTDDVHHALEGTTPYALNELVIDTVRANGNTYIAAVAQETLVEATAFATDHLFNPVACAALPEPGTFDAEVFFGALPAGRKMDIVRADKPTMQTGVVVLPQREVLADNAPASAADAQPADVPVNKAASEDPAAPAADTELEVISETDAVAEAPPSDDAQPDLAEPNLSEQANTAAQDAKVSLPENDLPAATAAPDAARDEPEFASRSKIVPPTINAATKSAPSVQPSDNAIASALAARRAPAEPAADGGARPAAQSPRIAQPIAGHAPAIQGSTARAGVTATPLAAPAQEPLFTRRKEPPAPVAGTARPKEPVSALAAAIAAQSGRQIIDDRPAAQQSTAQPGAAATATPAAGRVRERGKIPFLGLILTAVLLLVMLLVGLWSLTLPSGTVSGWFSGADTEDTELAALLQEPAPAAPVEDAVSQDSPAQNDELVAAPDVTLEELPAAEVNDISEPAPSAIVPQTVSAVAPPAPIVRAPAGRVLSPDEADRIYAATGVYQRAPRIAATPVSTALEGVDPVATVDVPEALDQPDMPAQDAAAPDAVIAEQPVPPAADVVFDRDARGNIAATTEGVVTPQGALVIAGAPELRPILRPGTPRVEIAPVAPIARPGDLVDAAEDAQTTQPAGNPAFVAGPPPLRPVLRPGDAAALTLPSTDVAEAPDLPVSPPYTGVRPRLRPGGLIATAATPDEAETVIAAYTGSRPVLRPAGIAPDVEAEAEDTTPAEEEAVVTADINAVAAAIAAAAPASSFSNRTALAVSVARRPDARPNNFAQVVARSRQAAAPPPAAAAPAPTRTAAVAATPAPPTIVAPSGNVPGGVAQAATVDNAMNLRQMNLVGVYGKPNARRALVRLGNGRFVKVEVGSALDGGQVTAIGDTALNFVKRGKTYALVLPG
ncbi:hypothetical protein [Loktanella sp. R86503]|uniref:hypothetical protein n=1 Tax=Loktanella sp. R86503 TaxID=3093847 RepID=UPI0036DE4561